MGTPRARGVFAARGFRGRFVVNQSSGGVQDAALAPHEVLTPREFEVFRRLAEEKGQAVITVTHDVQLSALTQRQIRLVDGRIGNQELERPPGPG